MIEVTKNQGESLSSMLRRFNRKVQQSGILLEARRSRFHEKSKSNTLKKRSALRRSEVKNYREYLVKIGKLGPDEQAKITATDLKRSNIK